MPAATLRRRWFALLWRTIRLLRQPGRLTDELVSASYDRIAPGYDEAWTAHMRAHAIRLLDRMGPVQGAEALDLTCGTGFVTEQLAQRTGGRVLGVDSSAAMLAVARETRDGQCKFVQGNAVEYVQGCEAESVDVITCAWGLGYAQPWRVLREASRVLRPGGRFAVIDNSTFSLAGVLWVSMLAFAERPEALAHAMRVQFLPGPRTLKWLMRAAGLSVSDAWGGRHTYTVPSGEAAIERLRATGAAAGFEFAAGAAEQEVVYARFAEILEGKYGGADGIPLTHRFLAASGRKR